MMATPKKLSTHPIHLGLGATAVSEPAFTGMAWYAEYGERHAADGNEARLISTHEFRGSWDSWEMHPAGAEVVLCVSGEITLVQEVDGVHVKTHLDAGAYAINAPGVWHTADVQTQATVVFITAGIGTQIRPR